MAGSRRPGLLGQHPMNIDDGTFARTKSPTPGLLGTSVGESRFSSSRVITNFVSSAAWPPATHDLLVKKAFPALSNTELLFIQNGSREVDMRYGTFPVTLMVSNAYKHAMTPCGMDKAEAIRKAHEWILNRWREAMKRQSTYDPNRRYSGTNDMFAPAALFAFGEGAHTYMDNTSPAHTYFEEYCYPNHPDVIGPSDEITEAIQFACEMREHEHNESHIPTVDEEARSTNILRDYFSRTFGEPALQIAVGATRRASAPPNLRSTSTSSTMALPSANTDSRERNLTHGSQPLPPPQIG